LEKPALRNDPYILHLLDRLDELEKTTRPSDGESSTERKDLKAMDSLTLAGHLVAHVAGWAVDHSVGIAFEGMKFVPLQPNKTKEHPQYLAELAAVNRHEHEHVAGVFKQDLNRQIDPFVARRALLNLLKPNSGAFPGWVTSALFSAIEALDYGEVHEILKPVKLGNKVGLTELRLQLRAVAAVYYRRRLGMTREKALEEVGAGINASPETILSWEKRLKNEFGRLHVERTIAFAQNHASWVEDANRRLMNEPNDTEARESLEWHSSGFDFDSLREIRDALNIARGA
jgi:hypothetical protein